MKESHRASVALCKTNGWFLAVKDSAFAAISPFGLASIGAPPDIRVEK